MLMPLSVWTVPLAWDVAALKKGLGPENGCRWADSHFSPFALRIDELGILTLPSKIMSTSSLHKSVLFQRNMGNSFMRA
jgi:hypothetical protein